MSDHPVAPDAPVLAVAAVIPVAPVPAHEPPYYAAVFTSVRTEGDGGYGETAERMEELVQGIPGYLGMDHARTPGGLSITVGYFRDEDAIKEWSAHAEHRAAQKRGRAEWYERYTLHIAKVERSHGFDRSRANDRSHGFDRSRANDRSHGFDPSRASDRSHGGVNERG